MYMESPPTSLTIRYRCSSCPSRLIEPHRADGIVYRRQERISVEQGLAMEVMSK